MQKVTIKRERERGMQKVTKKHSGMEKVTKKQREL
jgi:hypothetical protein